MSLVWCHRTSAARSSAISHPTIYDCFVLTPLNVTPTSEASVTSSGQWPLFMQSNAASAPFNCPECPLSSPLTTDHWPITLSTRYWSKPIHWLVYSYLHCRRHHCWRGKGTIIQAVKALTAKWKSFWRVIDWLMQQKAEKSSLVLLIPFFEMLKYLLIWTIGTIDNLNSNNYYILDTF